MRWRRARPTGGCLARHRRRILPPISASVLVVAAAARPLAASVGRPAFMLYTRLVGVVGGMTSPLFSLFSSPKKQFVIGVRIVRWCRADLIVQTALDLDFATLQLR